MYPRHALYRGNFGPAGFPARSPFVRRSFIRRILGGLLGGVIATGFTRPRYPYRFAGYGSEASHTAVLGREPAVIRHFIKEKTACIARAVFILKSPLPIDCSLPVLKT
ncbi:hypothetical protein QNN00_15450 [Bacillus velezensis]|nr:hypothetical protein [Bacillus velezensis]